MDIQKNHWNKIYQFREMLKMQINKMKEIFLEEVLLE